ncbi:MAG: LysR family transcriptional regulator [Hydrogenophaga sp.]|uniref:LysR family transcriptional regulator n=1 Tax=Hydrogenophaga sp. TaxID=1904254 RepID=UPI002ABC9C63|nr:LysR family transcriptional regulator [Hydrogenophaga sp.]MDZ4190229.1 LysR family transcriptional regulator [Hydrogenophaga sp.]
MNLSQKQLLLFITTAQTGHITQASERLGISQPTLTRALARFESDLGVMLFHRTTRRLSLTPEGQRFLPVAQRLLNEMENACEVLQGGSDAITGRVSLTMGSTVGGTLMPPQLKMFMRRHPGVRVRVVESYGLETTKSVRSGEVDLGIGTPQGDIAGLRCDLLLRAPLGIVYRRDQYKIRDGGLETLSNLPILKEGPNSSIIDLLRISGSPIVSMMSKGIDVTSLTMQLALVQAGMGVAVLSALAASHPQAVDLGFTLLDPPIERPVFLMQRTDRPANPAVAALAQVFLRDLQLVDLRPELQLPVAKVRAF